MPTISAFYGMLIQMCFRDHVPPHFRVAYGDYTASIDINKMELLGGALPRRALDLVLDWTELHQAELLENWRLCAARQAPLPISPLE
ncbi:DUF4160 domain-containing protein [Rugamonas sp.]|uniref:DUF4160 domain-containing protein n=1 Tax=Rugamonas sp. TaxID=1926287 RepID=UPI0025E3E74E|nr:DUF4160 domain-containing protein [Rugamonas sp.]